MKSGKAVLVFLQAKTLAGTHPEKEPSASSVLPEQVDSKGMRLPFGTIKYFGNTKSEGSYDSLEEVAILMNQRSEALHPQQPPPREASHRQVCSSLHAVEIISQIWQATHRQGLCLAQSAFSSHWATACTCQGGIFVCTSSEALIILHSILI